MIGQDHQVNEKPTSVSERDLLPVLRSYGHAINLLVMGAPSVATASLPAAGAANDGKVIAEWTGATVNLVIYSHGIRVRFSGTAF